MVPQRIFRSPCVAFYLGFALSCALRVERENIFDKATNFQGMQGRSTQLRSVIECVLR